MLSIKGTDRIHTVFIGLGSNLGDPKANLDRAVRLMREDACLELKKQSSLYYSKAQGSIEQNDFVNQVLCLETTLDPHALLNHCLNIETVCGRIRRAHWGPRVIDLDILLYDDLQMQSDHLKIPHPQLYHRDFVLAPLAELLGLSFEINGKTIAKWLDQLEVRYVIHPTFRTSEFLT